MIFNGVKNLKYFIKKMIFIVIIILISGCGLSDYKVDLPNGYVLYAPSAHNVYIILEDDKIIPPKVVEMNYDDRYIIAKQFGLKRKYPDNIQNTYQIPDETKIYYWIIDMYDGKSYGPFDNYNQFSNLMKELNIKSLELKNVESFREK